MSSQKVRVLIVDDSSVIRTLLTKILSSDPEIEVVATAPDPFVARDKLVALKPDVMTLDVEMPRMDGITFLKKVMQHFPVRTIVISSLTAAGSETAMQALSAGAVEVMEKPSLDVTRSMDALAQSITSRVKAAARAQLSALTKIASESAKHAAEPERIKKPSFALAKTTHQILAIASSTGGTEALKVVLRGLPHDIPGTLIVQHMPPVFTKSYAEQLNRICAFEVKEAEDGDAVVPGRALLAPGNFHMELTRSGAYYKVKLHQEPTMHGVRPAADYMMKSVAKYAGTNAVGVILTGMGRDGADGLLAMKNAGSFNIAQDEQSCVVFGMPKTAIELGAIHVVSPLDKIAHQILARLDKKAA